MAATPRAIGGRKNGGPKGGGRTVGNYTLLETVGQGTFGEVMIAVEKHTRESVAVKVLERDKITDDAARERLVNEIAILNRVHHANLLQLLEVIEDVDRIYLITEYIGGGELFNYIVEKGRLEESEAARLFAQMVAAVDSCHRNLVIHRDLKPENVLLDPSGDIKVIDFGLGAVLSSSDELLTVACGSPHYAAPEMLLGGGYYGQRVDMWSLGVCLYAMLCGCLPFDEPEMDDLYDRIIDGDYDFSPAPELSPAARDLVCGLLHMPPEERLTARAVLNHKWMRSAAPTPPATLGLLGAVLDPACRQLLRKMESEFGFVAAEVLEGLRRGERSPATAIYWLLRQRELKRGSIQHYAALLPRPPPARNASVRRRPVPGNIRAAAAKLPIPQALPSLPLAALGSNVQASMSARDTQPLSKVDPVKSARSASVHTPSVVGKPREEARAHVHQSGALTERADRHGAARRAHELALDARPVPARPWEVATPDPIGRSGVSAKRAPAIVDPVRATPLVDITSLRGPADIGFGVQGRRMRS